VFELAQTNIWDINEHKLYMKMGFAERKAASSLNDMY
jgi:hypothetical protein